MLTYPRLSFLGLRIQGCYVVRAKEAGCNDQDETLKGWEAMKRGDEAGQRERLRPRYCDEDNDRLRCRSRRTLASERGRARDRGMREEKLLATWRRRTRVAYPLRRPTTIVAVRGAFATDCTTRPNLPELRRTTGGLERPARAFRLSPPPSFPYYDVRSNATSTCTNLYSRHLFERKARDI